MLNGPQQICEIPQWSRIRVDRVPPICEDLRPVNQSAKICVPLTHSAKIGVPFNQFALDSRPVAQSAPASAQRLTFAFPLRIVARIMLPLTKRQREILDFLNDFIQQHGYAPSLEEIGRRFNLSSLATVHKHLTNLEEKGFIKRAWNRSRSVELVSTRLGARAVELPLLGYVAAGAPIEAVVGTESLAVPEALVGKRDSYVLRVKGDSMIEEHIRDGDYVIVEDRRTADNGEMVIALLNGSDVTLKKLYREHGRVRLQPANPTIQPIVVPADQVQIQGVVVGVMRRY
jgi:repressor LexA